MITEQQIQEVQRIVVTEVNPERVYLFGSLARGQHHKDSDMDLLVVVSEELNDELRIQVMMNLRKSTYIPKLMFPKDFLVYSKKEFEELKSDKYSFLFHVLKDARPLYAA